MASAFAAGKRALGECDICGFTYKLNTLKTTYIKGRATNLLACHSCWDPDHPQLRVGELPVNDPQALRNPRPDNAGYGQSRAQIIPVYTMVAAASAGYVTVSTP